MDPAQFIEGRSRETEIRRDGRGRWFNGEDEISHPILARSFDSWVDRAEDGRFCLSNAINWAYVEIEGPAYFVKDVDLGPEGIGLVLSGDLHTSRSTRPRSARGRRVRSGVPSEKAAVPRASTITPSAR